MGRWVLPSPSPYASLTPMSRRPQPARRRELPPISPLPVLSAHELRSVRLSLGFTQGGFAAAVGACRRSLQYWEQGVNPVPAMLTLAVRALSFRAVQRRSVARSRKLKRQLAESLRLSPPVKEKFY